MRSRIRPGGIEAAADEPGNRRFERRLIIALILALPAWIMAFGFWL